MGPQQADEVEDKICGELEDKVNSLNEYVNEVKGEQVIQVRVQQLALCKVLVNVHKKNIFILVKAYTSLGEAYLASKYYEQALDHLTTALKLNGSLFSQLDETKQYHAFILTLLGKCYMQAGSLADALGLLEKSLKMNKTVLGEEHFSNAGIYTTLSKVYLKKKDYDNAINYLSQVWELTEKSFGKDGLEIAQVYHDFAVAYSKKKDFPEAVKYQQKALENYRANEFDLEKRAEACITCSEWLVKIPDFDQALTCLNEAEEIFEQTYGLVDKKTCKLKRDIALLLLKANRYNEALEEVI